MQRKIYLFSEHLSAQTLEEIWLAGNPEQRGLKGIIEPMKQDSRSVEDIFKVVLENSGMLIPILGSLLAAWKLWLDGRRLKLDAEKHELDKRKQLLDEKKFLLEEEKWKQQQKEIAKQTPQTLIIQREADDDLVLPLELDDLEALQEKLKERLKAEKLENVSGIIIE